MSYWILTRSKLEKVFVLTPIMFAFGYIFLFMLWGKELSPKTFTYDSLFKKDTLIKHSVFAILFFILGMFRFKSHPAEAFYITPFVFILSIKLLNPIFQVLYNRNIIIATRWDRPPKGKNGIKILDRIIGPLITLFSISAPILLILLTENI